MVLSVFIDYNLKVWMVWWSLMDVVLEVEEGSKIEELVDVVLIYVSLWFVNKDN